MKFVSIMFRTALTLVAFATAFCVATTTLRNEAHAGIWMTDVEETSEPELANPYAEWRVFLVGTNDYSGALPDMRFAENDADEVRERLEGLGVPRENMTVLKGSNPEFYDSTSSVAIETRFAEFLDSLTEDSVAFVFFSGLGFEDNGPCYAPHDFRRDRVKKTRLSFDELAQKLAESPAKFKLLCADIARTPLPQERSLDIDYDTPREKADASNILVIMGCGAEENSYELPDLQHGIFTSVLLDAVSGAADANEDGETTVLEFVEFMNRNVSEKASALIHRKQVPDFKVNTYNLTNVLELTEFVLFPAQPDPDDMSQYIKSEEDDEADEEKAGEEDPETEEVEGADEQETEEVDADDEEETEEVEESEDGPDAAVEATGEEVAVAEEETEEVRDGEEATEEVEEMGDIPVSEDAAEEVIADVEEENEEVDVDEDGENVGASEDSEEVGNPYADWHVLLVGVTEYDTVPSLPSVKDVPSLKESLLRRGVPEGNIKTLESGNDPETAPTKENIERSLQEFVDGLTEDSTAFAYFSGHGVSCNNSESFFVPQDAKVIDSETWIPLISIVQTLSGTTAKFKCVTFDSSYSGGVIAEMGNEYSDVAVLCACQGDQTGMLDRKSGNISLFTHCAVRLLDRPDAPKFGLDSSYTLDELGDELTHDVEKKAEEQFSRKEQTPAFYFGDYGDDYLLFPGISRFRK